MEEKAESVVALGPRSPTSTGGPAARKWPRTSAAERAGAQRSCCSPPRVRRPWAEQAAKWLKPWLWTAKRRLLSRGRRKPGACTAGGASIRSGGSVHCMLCRSPACRSLRPVRADLRARAEAAAAWDDRIRRAGGAGAAASGRRRVGGGEWAAPAAGPSSRTASAAASCPPRHLPPPHPPLRPRPHAGGRTPTAGPKARRPSPASLPSEARGKSRARQDGRRVRASQAAAPKARPSRSRPHRRPRNGPDGPGPRGQGAADPDSAA